MGHFFFASRGSKDVKFYNVSDRYISFLKTFDSRVPNNYNENRPYIGVVLTVNGLEYLAPLSSPKPAHDNFQPENPTIHKLHEKRDATKKLGIVHINNMIPVIQTEITEISFGSQPQHYRDLLTKQYQFIKSTQGVLLKKASILHDAITNQKDPIYARFARVCCDFSVLEANYSNFKPGN